ncbi:unnamed protein product [Penicillium glandicola]
MESPKPSSFQAELQPQYTATLITEEPSGSSIPVSSPIPTESDQSVVVDTSPNEGADLVNSIQQGFPLPHGRNPEFAGRHIGLEFIQQNDELASRQVNEYLVQQILRQLEIMLANHEAINSHENDEDQDSRYAHGSAILQDRQLQNDEVEGRSLPRPTPQMHTRAASFIHSHSSNIPYYTGHGDNNQLRASDNSDDPSSDEGSQVRRGRSLRRSGSPVSDAFPEIGGSNHPSRDHSQLRRGRALLRASSVVSDPWAELWGSIHQSSGPSSPERRSRTLLRDRSLVSDTSSDLWSSNNRSDDSSQVRRGRSLLRASSVVGDPWVELWGPINPSSDPTPQEPRSGTPPRGESPVDEISGALANPLRHGNIEEDHSLPRPAPQAQTHASRSDHSHNLGRLVSIYLAPSPSSSSPHSETTVDSIEQERRDQTDLMVARWIDEVHRALHHETELNLSSASPEESTETLRPGHGLGPESWEVQDPYCSQVDQALAGHVITDRLYREAHGYPVPETGYTGGNAGRPTGRHAGFDGADDEPGTDAGGATGITETGAEAGGPGDEDVETSSDESAGGSDGTGWRCDRGVGGVGSERWRHRSGSHVEHVEEWDASAESDDSNDSGGVVLPLTARLTFTPTVQTPTESDEELSALAPRIIITPPDHEAESTRVQWVNPHLLHPRYQVFLFPCSEESS